MVEKLEKCTTFYVNELNEKKKYHITYLDKACVCVLDQLSGHMFHEHLEVCRMYSQ